VSLCRAREKHVICYTIEAELEQKIINNLPSCTHFPQIYVCARRMTQSLLFRLDFKIQSLSTNTYLRLVFHFYRVFINLTWNSLCGQFIGPTRLQCNILVFYLLQKNYANAETVKTVSMSHGLSSESKAIISFPLQSVCRKYLSRDFSRS